MVTVREHVAVAVADMLWLPRVNTEESVKLKKKIFQSDFTTSSHANASKSEITSVSFIY